MRAHCFLKTILFCLFCRFPFWFLKSSLFCITARCFGKCRFPVLVLENCQLSRRDHLEDLVLEKYGKLQLLAAGKTDFCIFGKLKRITRRASAKKSRYWKIILLVCQSGRFASADHNKHTNIVCLYWKISNKMMFLLYIGKFHSDYDYMENFIRKI